MWRDQNCSVNQLDDKNAFEIRRVEVFYAVCLCSLAGTQVSTEYAKSEHTTKNSHQNTIAQNPGHTVMHPNIPKMKKLASNLIQKILYYGLFFMQYMNYSADPDLFQALMRCVCGNNSKGSHKKLYFCSIFGYFVNVWSHRSVIFTFFI